MPSNKTHAYFAKINYDHLTNFSTKLINEKNHLLFANSTDPLMFYYKFWPFIGSDIRNLQYIFHREKSGKFFMTLIKKIKKYKFVNDKDCMSFLSGFLSHYMLDSKYHPVIFYLTGEFYKDNPKTHIYNGEHNILETKLDNYIVEKFPFAKKASNMKITNFSDELNKLINETFYEVYGFENMAKIYKLSLKHMKFLLKHLREDNSSFKRNFYKLIDNFLPEDAEKLEPVSNSFNFEDNDHHNKILNFSKKTLLNAFDGSIVTEDNFIQTIYKTNSETVKLIEDTFKYIINEGEKPEFSRFNKSLVTGLDCDEKISTVPKFINFKKPL